MAESDLPLPLYGGQDINFENVDLNELELAVRKKDVSGNIQHQKSTLEILKNKITEDVNNEILQLILTGGKGSVLRINKTGEKKLYEPLYDTNESRWNDCLKPALQECVSNDTIWIEEGHCLIPANQSMSQWIPGGRTGINVKCRNDEAAHVYTTPSKAGDDYKLFKGARNPMHFGAIRNLNFNAAPAGDSWGAFTACRFSFEPLLSGGDGSAPYLDEFGLVNRTGIAIVPDGAYRISQPLITQSNSVWWAQAGRCVLYYEHNIAPESEGVIKFAWTVSRNVINGSAQSNFTHDVKISGFCLFAHGTIGNELLGAMNFSGAQGSYLEDMTIGGFAGGIYCTAYTDLATFDNIDIGAISGKVCSPFTMYLANSCTVGTISIVGCNTTGAQKDTYNATYSPAPAKDDYRPNYSFVGCSAINILTLLSENSPKSVRLHACLGVTIHSIEASSPLSGLILDGTVIDTAGGGYNDFRFVRGYQMPNLIVDNNVLLSSGSTSPGWFHGNYDQGPRDIQAITCLNFISRGRLRFPVNTFLDFERPGGVSGAQLFRWRNDNADNNPTLNFVASSTDGSSAQTLMSFARYNGGFLNGYNTHFPDGNAVYFSDKIFPVKGLAFRQSSVNPTTADIPVGCKVTWKNITTNEIYDWINDNGTLKKTNAYT